MKETYKIHVMDIITFEATEIFAAGNIGGTSTDGDNDGSYTNSNNYGQ